MKTQIFYDTIYGVCLHGDATSVEDIEGEKAEKAFLDGLSDRDISPGSAYVSEELFNKIEKEYGISK